MAKDPAFLFYPGDWLGGTMSFTRHLKGCYIDLLMAQFNNGPLSLETIKIVLGTDQAVWTVLSKKFKRDSDGNFFNEKLATEINKRKAYTESRRANKSKKPEKPSYDASYDEHMITHMENENENVLGVGINDGGMGEEKKEGVFQKNESQFPKQDFEITLTESDVGGCIQYAHFVCKKTFSPGEIERKFSAFKIQNFTGNKFYQGHSDILKHFRDWLKFQKPESTENNGKSVTSQSKSNRTDSANNKLLASLHSDLAEFGSREEDFSG